MRPPQDQGPSDNSTPSADERLMQSLGKRSREHLPDGTTPDRQDLSQHAEIADGDQQQLDPGQLLLWCIQAADAPSQPGSTTVKIEINLDHMGAAIDSPERVDLEVLQRLNFTVVRHLGEGAFGRVYLARQPRTERPVAVKLTCNQGSEAHNLGQLNHDHIVKVHQEIEVAQRDLLILCMEYVPGPTLHGVVTSWANLPLARRNGQALLNLIDLQNSEPVGLDAAGWHDRQLLSGLDFVETVCWMGARLAGALDHAHQRHILHRDIKPANILLHPNGRPMLVDFNLAGSAQGASELFGGTPLYMAPEHLDALHKGASREAVDRRSDVYSLGLVLFEMLTGQRPFAAADPDLPREVAQRKMAEERRNRIPSPRQLRPEIPDVLDRAIQRCLNADPDGRYQTAAELAAVLDGCRELHRLHESLPPPGWLTRTALAHPQTVGILLPLVPHLVGALVCFLYAASWVPTHPHGAVLGERFGMLSLWYSLLIFPVTGGITYWLSRPIWRTVVRMREGSPLTADEVTMVRQRALHKPFWGVLLSGLGWLPGAVLLPLVLFVQLPEVAGWDVLLHYLLSFLIAGLIALTYTEFIDQFLLLRVAYPSLWVDPQQPRQVASVELSGLKRRLKVVQVLSTFVPLMTAVALLVGLYHELGSRGLSPTSRPFLVVILVLMGFGIAGSCLAVLVSEYLNRALVVLKGVREKRN